MSKITQFYAEIGPYTKKIMELFKEGKVTFAQTFPAEKRPEIVTALDLIIY